MKRRAVALVALAAVLAGSVAGALPPLNVLLNTADDYRPELGHYGSPALTPHLDRLARRAVTFDRAYCQQAVCNLLRSSMLTGLRPDTLGRWNNGTPLPTPAQVREMRHGYFANVSYLDAQIGKVLAALERSGAANRTIVVFVGDHGYHLGEHGLWAKTSTFELDARAPLMIASPDARHAGRRTAAFAELVDLFPTLNAQCDLPAVPGLDGTSLVPGLNDPSAAVKPAAYTQHPRPAYFDREPAKVPRTMGYSVRTAQGRYTEWRDWPTGGVVARELYAENDEPAETRNVVDSPRFAAARQVGEMLLRTQFPGSGASHRPISS